MAPGIAERAGRYGFMVWVAGALAGLKMAKDLMGIKQEKVEMQSVTGNKQLRSLLSSLEGTPQMTCLSCAHWDREGCLLGMFGFPAAGTKCQKFSYEPGSDEGEL